MEAIEKTFETLLKRQPSESEKVRLYELKETLGLRPDDAIWMITIALQWHLSLYEEIPVQISNVSLKARKDIEARTKKVLERFDQSWSEKLRKADRHLQAVGNEAVQKIAAESAQVIREAIRAANFKTSAWAYASCLFLSVVLISSGALGFALFLRYSQG